MLSSPLAPPLPDAPGKRDRWGQLSGAGFALALASAARQSDRLLLVLTPDVQSVQQLAENVRFFLGEESLPVQVFPDWEILPYDLFSPLPELVSQRLRCLHRLPELGRGILLLSLPTLLQRLPPPDYLVDHVHRLHLGAEVCSDRWEEAGYQPVSQVLAPGEYAVHGSRIDLFPMGSPLPYRLRVSQGKIEQIQPFDPETQRSQPETRDACLLLPAREFPLNPAAIAGFRQRYRDQFEGDPKQSLIYREISQGKVPGGIEAYLPLFFEETASLFDYLPPSTQIFLPEGFREIAADFWGTVKARYEQRRKDRERPPLPPEQLYLRADALPPYLRRFAEVHYGEAEVGQRKKGFSRSLNFATAPLPDLRIQARTAEPAQALKNFLAETPVRRVLFLAESPGRREMLAEHLAQFGIRPKPVAGWQAFLQSKIPLGLTTAPLDQSLFLTKEKLVLLTETQLYGERVRQARRRKGAWDGESLIRDLTELRQGAPVVHEEHGIGRYLGLQTLRVDGQEQEFLTLEYARGDRLYVPVSSLHLISRYTGASPENAPLHQLGGEQWARIKEKAAQRVRDVAAELLEIHARRAAKQGIAFPPPNADYAAFAAAFPFEETPDQEQAIQAVIQDMMAPQPMDRLICGDVGFGKTEVAMRAAFLAISGGYQVAVLAPTTLLAQQHFQNFSDRFADWPVRVELLSRFRTAREQKAVLRDLAAGQVDLLIGTHKLLQKSVRFQRLGLIIIDEEQRFGVRHKEALKALRAEVDLLTLTATPIPRTLNAALSGLRDLSIIATPPVARHPIKTFVTQWDEGLIREAIQRELRRGGQIYFLHNEVETIEKQAQELNTLVPEARIGIAHGQMRERELELIMRDFYHQRFNLLVCTTIIESGIDVPSANTILIHRADRFGMAQLHQLRGRVGRSHHRAYAYLIVPSPKAMTADAKKRLEAIASLEELGAGFALATHDLEIRGAGELLGEEQSGQMQEIGFHLYRELLERAVQALKTGQMPQNPPRSTEIDLGIPALIPATYLSDVHQRLVFYKRIASVADVQALQALRVEMIDRFGPLPEPAKTLFALTELKLFAQPYGLEKIEAGPTGGRIHFGENPKIDPQRLVLLMQREPKTFQFAGETKLRFFADLAEPSTRIPRVRELLKRLLGE